MNTPGTGCTAPLPAVVVQMQQLMISENPPQDVPTPTRLNTKANPFVPGALSSRTPNRLNTNTSIFVPTSSPVLSPVRLNTNANPFVPSSLAVPSHTPTRLNANASSFSSPAVLHTPTRLNTNASPFLPSSPAPRRTPTCLNSDAEPFMPVSLPVLSPTSHVTNGSPFIPGFPPVLSHMPTRLNSNAISFVPTSLPRTPNRFNNNAGPYMPCTPPDLSCTPIRLNAYANSFVPATNCTSRVDTEDSPGHIVDLCEMSNGEDHATPLQVTDGQPVPLHPDVAAGLRATPATTESAGCSHSHYGFSESRNASIRTSLVQLFQANVADSNAATKTSTDILETQKIIDYFCQKTDPEVKEECLAIYSSMNVYSTLTLFVYKSRFPIGDIVQMLRYDMSALQNKLQYILTDRDKRKRFLSHSLIEPIPVINLLQTFLDMPEVALPLKTSLGSAIAYLSKKSGCYPDCILLHGVEKTGDNVVAGGGFADIWKGQMDGVSVALKALRIFSNSLKEKALKNFSHEAVIWRQLKHPNILPFLGVFKGNERFERLCLVSPWMAAGNIKDFLKSNPGSDRKALLADIAKGLQYLHSFSPSVVHGDLKGANIFIAPDLTACLGDFGLARFRDSIESSQGSTTANSTGTLRWQAPELLQCSDSGDPTFPTRESDMYSFGCVCLEVMTDKRPFAEITKDGAVVLAIANKRKPRRPIGECVMRGMDDSMWEFMMRCWDDDPTNRPTTDHVVDYFNDREGAVHADSKVQEQYEPPQGLPASLGQYGFSDDDIAKLSIFDKFC